MPVCDVAEFGFGIESEIENETTMRANEEV